MPVSSRRQSRADDDDDDDEDILDAEDDEYDPFAAASSIDPDGRLMSEPSVIAMSPAVASVKERSIASGSFNSSRANPYNRSLGST